MRLLLILLLWMCLTGISLAATVTLIWDAANPATDVTSYRMYRANGTCASNAQLGMLRDVGLTLTMIDTVPNDGVTYCYAAKSYNAVAGLESVFSNKVEFTAPVPPNPPVAPQNLRGSVAP